MNLRQYLFAILSILASTIHCHAQFFHVSGRVSSDGEIVKNAKIVELDENLRILNQTHTDDLGYFTLKVVGEHTSLRVTADGMRKFVSKIGDKRKWDISLVKDTSYNVAPAFIRRIETSKLLVGHLNGHIIPQITWIEQISDTTFTFVIPIRVYSSVEDYPKGRRLCVQDINGNILLAAENIETVVSCEGTPKTYDPHVRTTSNYSTNNESTFTSSMNDYFCYPRFFVTKHDLELLANKSEELSVFAVDTSRGDNYWMYYTSKNFAKELQKILKKMQK